MNNSRNLTMHDLADEDKPREKLVSHGRKQLSNAELLAILIGSGTKDLNVVDLAKKILAEAHNSLNDLARFDLHQLSSFKGMGTAKSVSVMAAMELGFRMLNECGNNHEDLISDSQALFHYIAPRIIDQPIEEFWAIYLNNRHKVIYSKQIATGGINYTSVDVRRIFKPALENNATALIVAHNHPSGKLTPSIQDKDLTHKIAEAGKILDIKLLDHIIVGPSPDLERRYYSFADYGLI